jgi:hypothetical protein
MAIQTQSSDENLELLAKAFATLSECTNQLVSAKVRFDPDALDLALNFIGRKFFFTAPGTRGWQRDQFEHWIQDAPDACRTLINRSYGRTVTRRDVALLFKAPPPE